MAQHDPVTGPLSREQFAALVAAPYGEAVKAIRKHDPLYDRDEGEPIKWKIRLRRTSTETGIAYVEAATEKGAEALADLLNERDISWDYDDSDEFEIVSVEAAP